jgi:hypothetical protein
MFTADGVGGQLMASDSVCRSFSWYECVSGRGFRG